MNQAPLWAVIAGGWAGWGLFLGIITIFVFVYKKRFKERLDILLNLLNKHLFASLGVSAFNNLLKKLHLK